MRKSRRTILLIVFFLLLATGLTFFLFNAFTTGNDRTEKFFLEEEIRDIFISAENADVLVLPSANESTAIELSGSNRNTSLSTKLEGTQLTLMVHNSSSFFDFSSMDKAILTVHVPLVNSRTLNIQSDNGNLKILDIEPYEVSAYTTNGNIEIQNIHAKYFTADTENGNIIGEESNAHMIKVDSSNGNIHLKNVYGFTELMATSSNGNIDLWVSELVYSLEFEASNGDITIQSENMPTKGRFEASASNGNIDIFGEELELIVFDGDFPLFKADAVNGDIVVE